MRSLKKIQENICAIWRKTKQRIYSVSGQFKRNEKDNYDIDDKTNKFNIFTELKEKLRLMIIKTLKSLLDSQLQHFYFEIIFRVKNSKNEYKLPLIAQMENMEEAIALQQNLIDAIRDKNFDCLDVKRPKTINTTKDLERTKQIILNTQKISGCETIKIILYKESLENGIVKIIHNVDDVKEFKINVIKQGNIPFQQIKDLFVFKIDKSILEDKIEFTSDDQNIK